MIIHMVNYHEPFLPRPNITRILVISAYVMVWYITKGSNK